MDMDIPITVSGSSSNSSSMHHSSGMTMMGMLNTFSTSTTVTLFFTDWTTDTPAKYFGTLVFIFFITLLNRLLGAWRSQLGRVWADKAAIARLEQLRRSRIKRRNQRRQEQRDYNKSKPAPDPNHESCHSKTEEWVAESEALSPHLQQHAMDYDSETSFSDTEMAAKKQVAASLAPKWTAVFGGRWRAGNPWRLSIDAPRAFLEVFRALIGYLL
jgi:hypothetical protein